ncbi:KAT8 regulatory NSL complex subunit 2 isoform X1 [Bombyx mandarina]|uniref:KAT8 regulatory NSL complex subunit 2 n=4 Tax=Bombyx TaxID=7090 RepID=A0A8R2HUF8_BOMMO|nr:KAT8 regulatory NSL complex subunit 2 isoform X1 [Bombyx mori]XP_028033695.1 KAT8 regulatory NSL complex subunit 2 isoform X1 [Bombyx mandarina]
MFPFGREYANTLNAHNIKISELSSSVMTSQPRKLIHLPKVRMLSSGGPTKSGIRITNVRTIKPPDPEHVKKQEEEKLRAQVQKEIASRCRSCAYKGYECLQPVLSGRQYCYRHVLRDPTAPYRQCVHNYANGERCTLPAPMDTNDPRDPGLCFEHARAALALRQRQAAPPPPLPTTETLLHQLSHYIQAERPRTTSCASSVSVVSDPSEPEQSSPTVLDPFKQIDARSVNASYSASIQEYCSASDSDGDSVKLGENGECSSGDDELAPVEELPLWRAGVYTAEETVSEARNALKLLQMAYVNQMGRLRVLLQMSRAKYVKALKAEKEHYCSINTQTRNGPPTARERRQLRKLKAFASYHKKHGVDAVLGRKLHHKRAKVNDPHPSRPVPSTCRCTFSEGGVRCPAQALPAAKHCLKHILHDRHQALYIACGVCECAEVLPLAPLPSSVCRYHTQPPPYTVFAPKRDETESESESNSSSDESRTEAAESEVHTDAQDSLR